MPMCERMTNARCRDRTLDSTRYKAIGPKVAAPPLPGTEAVRANPRPTAAAPPTRTPASVRHAHAPRPRPRRPSPGRPTPQALLAALLAAPCTRARPGRARHPPDKTLCTISARRPHRPDALARPGPTPQRTPGRDQCAHEIARPEPRVPERAPLHPVSARQNPMYRFRPPATRARRSRKPGYAHPTAHTVAARWAHANAQTEPLVPDDAPATRQTAAPAPYVPVAAAVAPTFPPGPPNRAARRRWMHQQRRLHRAPPAARP